MRIAIYVFNVKCVNVFKAENKTDKCPFIVASSFEKKNIRKETNKIKMKSLMMLFVTFLL